MKSPLVDEFRPRSRAAGQIYLTMSLDAREACVQRIEEAMRNTLADFEIPVSLAVLSVQHVVNTGVFEVRIALMQGSPFVWSGRIREDCFDADLRANMAALRVWL